jgi:hypothetical protein
LIITRRIRVEFHGTTAPSQQFVRRIFLSLLIQPRLGEH